MSRRNQRRRSGRPRRGTQPAGPAYSRRINSISPSVSDGMFRLMDSFTLTSGTDSNAYSFLDRSFTQFAESKAISQLYTMVRLVAFELSLYPTPYAASTGLDVATSFGVTTDFVIGTNLGLEASTPVSALDVFACSDARTFNTVNRTTRFRFNSIIQRGGYMFTNLSSELAHPYAGSPGIVQIANNIPGQASQEQDIVHIIVTGVYQFSGRTLVPETSPEEKVSSKARIKKSSERNKPPSRVSEVLTPCALGHELGPIK